MMSPLAVSTYLESPEFQFDVVIFDEASQVLPWDAFCAVCRGRQRVVAGDQKLLPPSTFFDRMVNNDDDSEDADGLRELPWARRSADGTLVGGAKSLQYASECWAKPGTANSTVARGIEAR